MGFSAAPACAVGCYELPEHLIPVVVLAACQDQPCMISARLAAAAMYRSQGREAAKIMWQQLASRLVQKCNN